MNSSKELFCNNFGQDGIVGFSSRTQGYGSQILKVCSSLGDTEKGFSKLWVVGVGGPNLAVLSPYLLEC